MLSCYIIDDEEDSISALKSYIERTGELTLTGASKDPLEALKEIKKHNADITFINVDLRQLSGLVIAELITVKTKLIFTKDYSDSALESFKRNGVDFLLKPYSEETFQKVMGKIEADLKPTLQADTQIPGDYFFINPGVRGKVIKLFFSDILYIEGLKNYIVLYTIEGKHITYLSMSELENLLPPQFKRIQKSFIVNIGQIKVIESQFITLCNDKTLPLGGSYKEAFMKAIEAKTLRTCRKTKEV